MTCPRCGAEIGTLTVPRSRVARALERIAALPRLASPHIDGDYLSYDDVRRILVQAEQESTS